MSLYLRGNVWWSRIVRHGNVLQRSTKQSNKRVAQRVEARWISGLDTGDIQITKNTDNKDKFTTLTGLGERVFQYLEQNIGKRPIKQRTLDFYRESWAPIIRSELGTMYLYQVNERTIDEWTATRRRQVSLARVNGSLRTLRRFLKLAERWELVKRCPSIHINAEGENRREFVLSETVLEKFLAHGKSTPLLRDIVPFLVDTGLRITEALNLKWGDIDFDGDGALKVTEGKTKSARRVVPLTARAKKILRTLRGMSNQDQMYVFVNRDDHQLSRHWVSEQFREVRDAMGLPEDCVIHSCRHTFCTRLGESGADVFTLKTLAGHSSVTISQRYVHPRHDVQAAAIKKMEATAAR